MNKNGRPTNKSFRYCHGCHGSKCNRSCEEAKSGKNHAFISKKERTMPNQFKFRVVKKFRSPMQNPSIHYSRYMSLLKYYNDHTMKKKNKTRRYQINDFRGGVKKKEKTSKCIDCPICMSVKGKYKTLGCGHELCDECHFNILNSDTLQDQCPICRKNMFSENYKTYVIYRNHHGTSGKYTLVNADSPTDNESEFDFEGDYGDDGYDSYDSDDGYDSDESYESYDSNEFELPDNCVDCVDCANCF